jgi:hypothetical protein
MKRIILVYGLISGLISAGLIGALTLVLNMEDMSAGMTYGMVIGFTGMILAFSLIFFAIQSYKKAHGPVNFGQAFLIGLGITLICSTFYVIAWEIVFYNFMPNFMDVYSAQMIAQAKAGGMSGKELEAMIAQFEQEKIDYPKPWVITYKTYLEIAPVGILMSLIAATIEQFRYKKRIATQLS